MRRVLFRLLLDLLCMLLLCLRPLFSCPALRFRLLRLNLRTFSLALRILGSFAGFLPLLIQFGLAFSSYPQCTRFLCRLNGAARGSLDRLIAMVRVEIVFRLLQ